MGLRIVLAAVLAVSAFSIDASAQRRDRGYSGYNTGVTVYEDPDFRGDSATFRNEVADLRADGMNDRISSIHVNGNQAWEVCRDVNFTGGCRVFSGSVEDLRQEGWNDRISSMREVGYARNGNGNVNNRGGWWDYGNGNGRGSQTRLVVFDRTNFRGTSRDIVNNANNLGSIGDRARSVQVFGGTWELCDGAYSNSRCVTVSQSISDLRTLGLRNGVASVREVGNNQRSRRWWE
jgi:hypothetical protein